MNPNQLFHQYPVIEPFYTTIEKNFRSEPYVRFASTTYPLLPFCIIICYLCFIFTVPSIMKNKNPFHLQKSIAIWNLILTIFSFCGMIRTVPHLFYMLQITSFRGTLCLPPILVDSEGACGLWKMLFVFSKVCELLDTVFLVLCKKKVVFLHWYHHTTVLLLCWHAYVYQSSVGLYFMTMNYSIHTFMYGYYFLKSIHQWPQWMSPQFITIAQISQMMIGSFICIMSYLYWLDGKTCYIQIYSLVPAGIIYTTYLYLFSQFFFKRFIQNKPKII